MSVQYSLPNHKASFHEGESRLRWDKKAPLALAGEKIDVLRCEYKIK